MALLAYQGRVGLLPRYLSTLLSDYKPARTLRSGFGAPLLQTRRMYEMNWLGALLEWQLLLCGTLCLLRLDLPPRLILSRLY